MKMTSDAKGFFGILSVMCGLGWLGGLVRIPPYSVGMITLLFGFMFLFLGLAVFTEDV